MSDFEYDCMKKKQLAGQARYRKRGSKSKKCSLPSDGMTEKQWKDRCGPVVSYNFNKPITWGEFKNLPVSTQAEYIINLQKKYGVTAVDLGNMFGVRALTVRKHADANGLSVEFPRGHAMSAARKVEWGKFLSNNEEEMAEPDEQDSEDDAMAEELFVNDCEQLKQNPMKMNSFSLLFSGTIDVNAIANSLRLILGGESTGEMEIICHLE